MKKNETATTKQKTTTAKKKKKKPEEALVGWVLGLGRVTLEGVLEVEFQAWDPSRLSGTRGGRGDADWFPLRSLEVLFWSLLTPLL